MRLQICQHARAPNWRQVKRRGARTLVVDPVGIRIEAGILVEQLLRCLVNLGNSHQGCATVLPRRKTLGEGSVGHLDAWKRG